VSVVNPGTYRHWVTLDDPVVDGTPVTVSPARVKCAIRPSTPGAFDEDKVTYIVEMRFHPQVTFNTRLTHIDSRDVEHQLFVRGIQNVDMRDRHLVLLCEEVMTP
jgi:hypothetical protein